MRRRISLRRSRLPRVALALAAPMVPVVGAGLAEAAADTSANSTASSQSSIQMNVSQRQIGYGQQLTVTGRAPSGAAGQRVRLDFAPAGSSAWRPVAQTHVGGGGNFKLEARLRRSGRVKVKGTWGGTPSRGASSSASGGGASTMTTRSGAGSNGADSADQPVSPSRIVKVSAGLHVAPHATDDLGAHVITVRGTLLPGAGGRLVHLQSFSGGRWRNAGQARTDAHGRFQMRYSPRSGHQWLRVAFGGDRSNAASSARAGTVTVFTQGVASWYSDGGGTACGFHAQYGVANVSLPCGSKVTFVYRGHRVTATVDDRGPYVGGRKWDLNQNTASALGFGGVASVWASR